MADFQWQIEDRVEAKLNCDPKLRDWLCERIDCTLEMLGEEINVPRWWQMFWMITRNGGFAVHGWGCLSGGGLFGYGLDMKDALDLVKYDWFIQGYSVAMSQNQYELLNPAYEEFVTAHNEAKEQEANYV